MTDRADALKKLSQRGGALDVLLVGLVVVAVWTHTPLGGIGQWAKAKATGSTENVPRLIASFSTGVVDEFVTRVEAVVLSPRPISDLPPGSFPEPYRSAAAAVLATQSIPPASQDRAGWGGKGAEAHLAILDELHSGTNAEATLEIYALGEAQRTRAIERARSAGEADPESYMAHRRYLPAASQRLGDQVVASTIGAANMLSLAWPVEGDWRISSPYGYRHHPVLAKRKFHNGVDLAVPEGTPILAAQQGKVSVASEDGVNGKYLVLDHGYGVKTSYCHLSELDVEAGDRVTRGQEVALSGNTGRSTGPHLHFVLRIGKQTVDPEGFRPDNLKPDAAEPVPLEKIEAEVAPPRAPEVVLVEDAEPGLGAPEGAIERVVSPRLAPPVE